MTVRRIVPNIGSAQPERSREFYADFLGLRLAMDMGWIVTFASPTNPTAQISVIRDSGSSAAEPHVTVEVEDVDAIHAAAVERGCQIVHPLTDEPWGVRRFFVVDPNGLVLNVMSHREDPASS